MKKSGKLTQQAVKSLYPNHTSFIDFLPWVEYLPNSQCLLLDDGVSVGAVFEAIPVGTEGRTETRLEEIRDIVEDAFQDSFEERDSHPWVIQFFAKMKPILRNISTNYDITLNHGRKVLFLRQHIYRSLNGICEGLQYPKACLLIRQ